MTSQSDSQLKPVLEDCRGDFERISAMMEASWAGGAQPPFLYTSTFLRSCFDYPGASLSLAPTIYSNGEPMAFAAGFPRTLRIGDSELRILLITFLTAAAEFKRSGYGLVVWSELAKRARAAGFDGMLNYCVDGEPMNRMIEGACRRLEMPVCRVQSVSFTSKLLLGKQPPDLDGEPPPSTTDFIELAAQLAPRTPLLRTWTPAEATWQYSRTGIVACHHATDSRRGILIGYVMPIADRSRTKCLLIEDVLWEELDEEERDVLARRLLAKAAAAGARLAVLPQMGYADTRAFDDAGFRPSGRVVHMYLSLWNAPAVTQPVAASYVDIL